MAIGVLNVMRKPKPGRSASTSARSDAGRTGAFHTQVLPGWIAGPPRCVRPERLVSWLRRQQRVGRSRRERRVIRRRLRILELDGKTVKKIAQCGK